MKTNWIVYCHTNKANGKKYFGITCQTPNQRWRKGNGYKQCIYFKKAIDKYGWDGFKHEIVMCGLNEANAKQAEKDYISKFNTNNAKFGYNMTEGGDGTTGRKMSDKVKEALKPYWENRKGANNSFFGKHHTEEQKQRWRLSRGRAVICLDTGVIYRSIAEAARVINRDSAAIWHCLIGKTEHCAGLKWAYVSEAKGL